MCMMSSPGPPAAAAVTAARCSPSDGAQLSGSSPSSTESWAQLVITRCGGSWLRLSSRTSTMASSAAGEEEDLMESPPAAPTLNVMTWVSQPTWPLPREIAPSWGAPPPSSWGFDAAHAMHLTSPDGEEREGWDQDRHLG